jgi:hypothetical protein
MVLRAVNTGLLPERRPNTAGLQQHKNPWTTEKLRGVVTSNCVGTSAWKSTMRDLDHFSTRFAGLGSAEDDDASSTATGKAGQPDPPRLQPLLRVNLVYSVGAIPDDSVLLKYMRALSALQGAILRRRQVSSPSDAALLSRVLQMMVQNDLQHMETKGVADFKALFRSTFIDRVSNTIRAERSPAAACSAQEGVPFLDIFNAFDCAKDNYIPTRPFQAALRFIDSPSSANFIRYFFITAHIFSASIHIAEARTALQLLSEIAESAGDIRATSLKPTQATSAASLFGSRDKVDAEFRQLCDMVFPIVGTATRDRQLVDSMKWADMRTVIGQDNLFQSLSAIIAENSLY